MPETLYGEKHKKLLAKLKQLKINSDIFGESFMNDPRPKWYKIYKDGKFKMLIVNKAYTEKTGLSVAAYYLQSDEVVWDDNVANSFLENDLKCVRRRIRITVEETGKNPMTGKEEVWVGFKTPRFDPKTKTVIGVHGQADVWDKEVWDTVPNSIKKVIKLEY